MGYGRPPGVAGAGVAGVEAEAAGFFFLIHGSQQILIDTIWGTEERKEKERQGHNRHFTLLLIKNEYNIILSYT